jgi:hypothetical protein
MRLNGQGKGYWERIEQEDGRVGWEGDFYKRYVIVKLCV